jgi:hypothetical protein
MGKTLAAAAAAVVVHGGDEPKARPVAPEITRSGGRAAIVTGDPAGLTEASRTCGCSSANRWTCSSTRPATTMVVNHESTNRFRAHRASACRLRRRPDYRPPKANVPANLSEVRYHIAAGISRSHACPVRFRGGTTSGGRPAENLISPLSISDSTERLWGKNSQCTTNRRRR